MIYYDPKNDSKTVKTYALSFTTTMFEESDPHEKCKNYPTEKYKNFKECDDEFLKDFFGQQNVGIPIWLLDVYSVDRDANTFSAKNDNFDFYNNVVSGITQSNCSKPCIEVTTISRTVLFYGRLKEIITYFMTFYHKGPKS